MCQILPLLWMHFTLRRRRPVLLVIELAAVLLPLLFALVFRGGESGVLSYKQYSTVNVNNSQFRKDLLYYERSPKRPKTLMYTPYSKENAKLFKCVQFHLEEVHGWMPRRKGVANYFLRYERSKDPNYQVQITHSDDTSEINKFISNIDEQSALVIIFENSNVSEGGKLDYAIRMKNEIMDAEINNFFNHSFTLNDYHPEFLDGYKGFMNVVYPMGFCFLGLNGTAGHAMDETNRDIGVLHYGRVPFIFRHDVSIRVVVDKAVIICMYCTLSLAIPFICIVLRLVTFRTNGSEKFICGNGVSYTQLIFTHIICMLPIGALYVFTMVFIIKIQLDGIQSDDKRYTIDYFYIFGILIIHFLTVLAFAFFASLFPGNTDYIIPQAFFIYFGATAIFYGADVIRRTTKKIEFYHMFLLHGPLSWFFTELEFFITNKTIANHSMILHYNHTEHSYPIGMAFVASLMQLVLLIIGFMVVSYFYSCCCLVIRGRGNRRCFEEAPRGKGTMLRVCNLTKKHGKIWAVKNARFNLYQGEVTMLMGNNGSGKSTLLSMLAGATRPTWGSYCFANTTVGWCPQRNMSVPGLTVGDHIRLFNSIRGFRRTKDVMKFLNLSKKTGYYPDDMSNGEQRRFQLACAMVGGTRILLLDEPFSGMDTITRNEIWAFLLSLRGNVTMLLTNYQADTACSLGDRVLTMNKGRITMHASPTYLQPDVYRLFMTHTTTEKYCECKVNQIIMREVPGAELIRPSPACVSYYLPTTQRAKFAAMFEEIEAKQKDLGITSMRLGKPVLKDGFIARCTAKENHRDCLCRGMSVYDDYERHKGCRLKASQVFELFRRHVYYILHTLPAFLFVHALLLLSADYIRRTNIWKPIDEVTQHVPTTMDLKNYQSIVLPNKAAYKGAVAVQRDLYDRNYHKEDKNLKKKSDQILEVAFPFDGKNIEYFYTDLYDLTEKVYPKGNGLTTFDTKIKHASWHLTHDFDDFWGHTRWRDPEELKLRDLSPNNTHFRANVDKNVDYFFFYDFFYTVNATDNLVPLFSVRPEMLWHNHTYFNHTESVTEMRRRTKKVGDETVEETYSEVVNTIDHYATEILRSVNLMKIRVSSSIPHTGPAGMNSMWNAFAKSLHGVDNPITTKSWPIRTEMAPLYDYWNRMFETIFVSLIYQTALLSCVGWPLAERISGTRRLLYSTNLSPYLFWISRFIFNLIFYMLIFPLPLMIYLYKRTVGDNFVVCTFLIFFVGTFDLLWFIYLLTFLLKDTLNTIIIVALFYGGVCLAAIHSFYTYVRYIVHPFLPLEVVLPISELVLPPQTFTMAIIRTCMAPMIWPTEHTHGEQKIVGNVLQMRNYFPYRDIFLMCLQAIVLPILVLFIESGFIRRFLQAGSKLGFKKPPRSKKTDRNLIKEEQYVRRLIGTPEKKETKESSYKGPIIRPANLAYTVRPDPNAPAKPKDKKPKEKSDKSQYHLGCIPLQDFGASSSKSASSQKASKSKSASSTKKSSKSKSDSPKKSSTSRSMSPAKSAKSEKTNKPARSSSAPSKKTAVPAKKRAPPKPTDAFLVDDLHKAYFGVKPNPCRSFTVSVKNGEILGLYGLSGCGKSSAMKSIAIEVIPDAGKLQSGETYYTSYTDRGSYQYMIGYCGEKCELDYFLTPHRIMGLMCGLRGIKHRDLVIKRHAWLALFSLQKHSGKKFYKFNMGQQRMVMAATACVVDAPLTMVDAGAANLDADSRRLLWLGLQHIRGNKRGVLIAQHSTEEMENYADRVAVMRNGELCAIGPLSYLKHNYKIMFTATFYFKRLVKETKKGDKELKKFDEHMHNEFIIRNTYHPLAYMMAVYQLGVMPHSKVFERLERVKSENSGLVRDYEVSENTLEDSLAYISTGKKVAPVY